MGGNLSSEPELEFSIAMRTFLGPANPSEMQDSAKPPDAFGSYFYSSFVKLMCTFNLMTEALLSAKTSPDDFSWFQCLVGKSQIGQPRQLRLVTH